MVAKMLEILEDVYVYIRVSSETQADEEKVSQSEQLHDIKEYCSSNGHRIIRIFEDVAPGTDIYRPGFLEMLEMAVAGPVKTIVCWNASRLARGMTATDMVQHAMDDFDVVVEGARETINPDTFAFQGFMGGLELRYIRMRSIMGKVGRAKQGKIPNRRICYGYTTDSESFPILDEDAAKVVKYVYDLAIDKDMATAKIAKRLNLENIPTRGSSLRGWTQSSVRKMLRNPTYKGTWIYGRARHRKTQSGIRITPQPENNHVEVTVPQIISRERWDLAQSTLDKRRTTAKRNTKHFYMLQGLMKCAECGRKLASKATTSRLVMKEGKLYHYPMDPPHRYYECYGIIYDKTECRYPKTIPAELLEQFIWNEILDIILDPDRFLAKLEQKSSGLQEKGELEDGIRDTTRILEEQDLSIQKMLDVYEDGTITKEELERKLERIRARQDHYRSVLADLELEQQEHSLKAAQAGQLREWASNLRGQMDNLTDEQRREIVSATLTRIELDSHNNVRMTMGWNPKFVAVENTARRRGILNSDKTFSHTWSRQLPHPLPPSLLDIDENSRYKIIIGRNISNAIREARYAHRLTLSKLGDLIGVYSETITTWEHGHSLPSPVHLKKLIECLGLKIDDAINNGRVFDEKPSTSLHLADSIIRKRTTAGLSQRELAHLIDVPIQTLDEWATGNTLPPLPKLVLLSDNLGLSITDLIPVTKGIPFTLGTKMLQKRLQEGLSARETGQRLGAPLISYSTWEERS